MEEVYTDTTERTEQIEGEIRALKQLLSQSDYKAMKYFEGQLSEEEYSNVKEQRKMFRAKINRLESELENMEGGTGWA